VLPVSAAFQAEVKGPHNAVVKIEAWFGGQRIDGGGAMSGLQVVDGTVTVDASAAIRRTYSATIAQQSAFPTFTDYAGVFSPFGTVHKVFRGVQYPTGRVEWCQLGTFRLDGPATSLEPGTVKVTGSDLSKVVQDNRFLSPTTTVTTNRIPVELTRHLRGALGSAQAVRDLTGDTHLTPAMTWDRDRWQGLRDLALSIGAEVIFGVDGTALIQYVPDVTNAVVWTVTAAGAAAGGDIIITGDRELDRSSVYNCVVATGERTDNVPPARGVAYDLNPSSPTYVGNPIGSSPFGLVPAFYSSPVLTTNTACTKAAQTILNRTKALQRRVTFECVPNPAVDGGDVARIYLPNSTSEVHIIDSVQVPLTVTGTMRVATRTSTEANLQ
jgi:hypothetical protein